MATTSQGMELYYIYFGGKRSFRLPELQSIAQLFNFDLHLSPFPAPVIARYRAEGCGLDAPWDVDGRPVLIVGLGSEEHAKKIAERCVSVISIHKLYHVRPTFPDLSNMLRSLAKDREHRPWDVAIEPTLSDPSSSATPASPGRKWRFRMESYGKTIDMVQQQSMMKELRHLDMKGKIALKGNDLLEFSIFEEYHHDAVSKASTAVLCYFGILIGNSRGRALISKYNVKQRAHIGNTTMDAEVSLLMANQALARDGSCVWDCFAGTGSMLLACAEWGSRVWGSDIDGRQMRGKKALNGMKGETPGIRRSAAQYGTEHCVVDLLTFDVTRSPLRMSRMFDAIVTDPPYGVRAGAKRLGRKDSSLLRKEPFQAPDGSLPHTRPDYIPPFRPYELVDLAWDLCRLARYALKPGGRLVFFLPVVNDEYDDVDVPVVEGLRLVANSVEDFGKWSRRLITLELDNDAAPVPAPKFDSDELDPTSARSGSTVQARAALSTAELSASDPLTPAREPGHKDFAKKYFRGFQPLGATDSGEPASKVEDV